ncbi:ATP-binding cassette domain-containing protein [Nocardia sp. CDC153]|uniref:ATP-binding cassette domain-containing protein n=1 Tax=Nocardia sp. CDC153 TaxID=3112167 RepID=UPI002DBB9252|nr:ATP-binding cassette domain-containing protein [Nocardia sp. CDC153]MEC3958479.1 ATP-binding cassette domain-containing protein [Nocardia sp. CDC153]
MGRTDSVAITANGVSKQFEGAVGLDRVDLEVPTGTVTSLLGPNGAGKTTMVRILSTLLRPDSGMIRVAGHDVLREPERVRALIGLTGQSVAVDAKLSGPENLRMFGRLNRLSWPVVRERSAPLLETFELDRAGKRAVKTYSGGMRRKLDLALSLMAQPRILFLDEPTTGLDPASRHALWDVIGSLVRQGSTVMLTTQYLDEADALADSIVFLDGGRVIATGTPAELKARAASTQLVLTMASEPDAVRLTTGLEGFHAVADHRTVRIAVPANGGDGLNELRAVLDAALRTDVDVESYTVREPDLDDVYFHLTGHARPVEMKDAA